MMAIILKGQDCVIPGLTRDPAAFRAAPESWTPGQVRGGVGGLAVTPGRLSRGDYA